MDLHREVLAPAERPADPGEVDPHLLRAQAEARRDLVAVDVEPLGRDVDVDTPLAVGHREARLRSEERLVLDPELVRPADDDVARRVGVAVPDHDVADDVGPRIVPVAVAHRRPVRVERLLLERALHVHHGLERLVLDDDRLERLPRLLRVLGGDDRHRLADVAHAVDREHGLVGELEAVELRPRDVRVREDGVHAGHAQGGGQVDRDDPCVRVRAPERVAPQHPGCREVARVLESAVDLGDGVVTEHAVADAPDRQPRAGGGDAHRRSIASRTASKIFT